MTNKRKRVSGGAANVGAKSNGNTAESSEGHDKKRRKRSASPNTDPVSTRISITGFMLFYQLLTRVHEYNLNVIGLLTYIHCRLKLSFSYIYDWRSIHFT